MTARMTKDMAVAIVSHSWSHPAAKVTEAAQALLWHMRLQETRIRLLEKALKDTGNDLVRARIEACRVREPLPEVVETRGWPSPEPLAKPPEKPEPDLRGAAWDGTAASESATA